MLGPSSRLIRIIWSLAWPAIVTSLLGTLVFVADRVMLARYDQQALSSMQLQGPLMWSLGSIFMGLCVGTVALIARNVGALELRKARAAARASIRLSLVLGIAVGGLGLLLLDPLLHLLGGDDLVVRGLSRSYLRIAFAWALPAEFVAATASMIHYAHGDTRTPLLAGLLGNLANVGVNAWLIFGLGSIEPLGVPGAAWGTAVAFILQALVLLALLQRRAHPRGASVWRWLFVRPGREEMRSGTQLLRLGGPAMLERIVIHAGYLAFLHAITSLGAVTMAANQAVVTLESVCFLTADGFGIAAGSLVGQALGRDDIQQARHGAMLTASMAVGVLSVLGLLLWVFAPILLEIFTTDHGSNAEMVTEALAAMPILVLAQPFMAAATVTAQALRGAGDTRSPVWAAVFGGLFLRVGTAQWLVHTTTLGLAGIWWASTIDWCARTLWLVLVFRRGGWAHVLLERPKASS